MINSITDEKGNKFDYHQETDQIFLNGVEVSPHDYEPVFINSTISDDLPPIFSGILMKLTGKILGLNGKTNIILNG